jgi:hypothetical protein
MSDDRESGADDVREGELIDPRELRDRESDRFEYRDVVDQLAELVDVVEPPSNVALFAPWGSGKTSVAHMLRHTLAGKAAPGNVRNEPWTGVQFAYFDAFRFNDLPLRREFVKSLGDELGVRERNVDRDLYAGRTWTEFVPPRSDLPRLLLFWLGAIAILASIGLALAVLAAALSAGPFETAFSEIVDQYDVLGSGWVKAVHAQEIRRRDAGQMVYARVALDIGQQCQFRAYLPPPATPR